MSPAQKFLWAAFLFLASTLCIAQSNIEQQKIEYLIGSIGQLHDAHFIRNGTEYDADRAADHLRTKLRYAGSRIRTAEDFIRYCATGSSVTGEKYQIRFADGHSVEAATFFKDKLAEFKPQAPSRSPASRDHSVDTRDRARSSQREGFPGLPARG